ncbi:MAG: hypothetical protein ABGW69_00535 [Nanoarchaeota archaeon]
MKKSNISEVFFYIFLSLVIIVFYVAFIKQPNDIKVNSSIQVQNELNHGKIYDIKRYDLKENISLINYGTLYAFKVRYSNKTYTCFFLNGYRGVGLWCDKD